MPGSHLLDGVILALDILRRLFGTIHWQTLEFEGFHARRRMAAFIELSEALIPVLIDAPRFHCEVFRVATDPVSTEVAEMPIRLDPAFHMCGREVSPVIQCKYAEMDGKFLILATPRESFGDRALYIPGDPFRVQPAAVLHAIGRKSTINLLHEPFHCGSESRAWRGKEVCFSFLQAHWTVFEEYCK
jgi:hypothetical protein